MVDAGRGGKEATSEGRSLHPFALSDFSKASVFSRWIVDPALLPPSTLS